MKFLITFLIFGLSFSSLGTEVKKEAFSIKVRNLENIKPSHLIELIAKNDDRNSIENIESFELKKQQKHFTYEFFPYAGEGINKRFGKIDFKGVTLERGIDYDYCAHSMGPENKCYVAKLVETLNIDKKTWTIKGLCKITKIKGNKVIHNIIIINKKTLKEAESFCKASTFKFLVPTTIDVKLLKPLVKK